MKKPVVVVVVAHPITQIQSRRQLKRGVIFSPFHIKTDPQNDTEDFPPNCSSRFILMTIHKFSLDTHHSDCKFWIFQSSIWKPYLYMNPSSGTELLVTLQSPKILNWPSSSLDSNFRPFCEILTLVNIKVGLRRRRFQSNCLNSDFGPFLLIFWELVFSLRKAPIMHFPINFFCPKYDFFQVKKSWFHKLALKTGFCRKKMLPVTSASKWTKYQCGAQRSDPLAVQVLFTEIFKNEKLSNKVYKITLMMMIILFLGRGGGNFFIVWALITWHCLRLRN